MGKHKYPHTGMVSTKFYRGIGFAEAEKYVTILEKYQTLIAEVGKRRNGKNKENQKKRRQCG